MTARHLPRAPLTDLELHSPSMARRSTGRFVLAGLALGAFATLPACSPTLELTTADAAAETDARAPAVDAVDTVDAVDGGASAPVDAASFDVPMPRDATAEADAARPRDVTTAPDASAPRDVVVAVDAPVIHDAPPTSNADTYCPGGACVHWWNCRVTYQYQYPSSHDWDTDFHMVDGTPIALPHASRLTAVYLAGAGFQPEFTDLVSGEWVHFNHLHLNSEFGGNDHALGPVQLVALTDAAHPDHIYPAGWVVGFSGGGTTGTGYLGTDSAGNVCTGGHSTAAHFCAVTHAAHTINYFLPTDSAGCPMTGWPTTLWATLHPLAPRYASCPSACNACGVAHF